MSEGDNIADEIAIDKAWTALVRRFGERKDLDTLCCPRCGACSMQYMVYEQRSGFCLRCSDCNDFTEVRGVPEWF